MKKNVIRIVRIFLVLCLVTCLTATVLSKPEVEASANNETESIFRIGICYDEGRPYNAYVLMGYKDALYDAYGSDRVIFAEQNVAETATPATAVETLLQTKAQLLFTFGDQSLEAAASLTNTIPIVFGDVSNYSDALHLLPTDKRNTTGRNVTGVSSLSPVSEQLSLIIEVADHFPKAVGILYDPTDTNAVFQNNMIEKYLTEAGIPWKEYEIKEPSLHSTKPDTANPVPLNTPTVAFPTIQAAASGKEGPNIHPDSIGESGDLTGINEPMSARSVQISPIWNGPPIQDAPPAETLTAAFNECDVVYLCSNNAIMKNQKLLEQMTALSLQTQTATVSGNNCNEPEPSHTLACLYEDPYNLGYQCGLVSIDILNKKTDIAETPILSPDPEKTVKLYNASLSDALKKTWPKSFHEDIAYFADYVPGELTERLTEK